MPRPKFDDVEVDGTQVDESASDRVLFHVIATRAEIGDLPVDEAWAALAERYPDDVRLRLLAIAADVDTNGVRDPEWLVSVMQSIAPTIDEASRPALSGLVAVAFEDLGPENALRSRARALVANWPKSATEAHRALRALETKVLVEADERTRGGRPWGERAAERVAEVVTKPNAPPRPYSPTEAYERGDRLVHPKFGEGVVLGAAEGKIEVAFGDERKRLVARP
ncbi:MAG: hypothetical protein HYV09_15000 [Deltaproteobacteria bacterium]|nr:hypothetical protein [Deltaproteobacteria bacterium]